MNDNYTELCNAIILKAVKDYKRLYKRHLKFPDDDKNTREMEKVRRYFRGNLFKVHSSHIEFSGEEIIKHIECEVQTNVRRSNESRVGA